MSAEEKVRDGSKTVAGPARALLRAEGRAHNDACGS